ncbi:MAG: ImcF-related family protein [Longimicrobiales bacterium]
MFSLPALGAVGILGWYVAALLGLGGWKLWVLRVAIWALGAVAVFLISRLLPKKGPKQSETPESSEIADHLSAATQRLLASGVAGKKGLKTLPVVLVMGPPQSAKTSVIQQVGMELDFLAGDGDGGEPPPPTPNLNLWLSRDTVLLEAGEQASESSKAWETVLDRVRTGFWSGLFKDQPARFAVVCVGTELLTEKDRGEIRDLARELRERLNEAAAALDRRLPVYVLFTKADKLPHFTEFVRNLTEAEAREPLGATLPLAGAQDPGLYNRWQGERLDQALESVFLSLARRRPEVMAREGNPGDRTAAFEFPREFRKVADLARDFLLELTRPSQLRISPFLRGLYFTGIRPVSLNARPEPVVAAPLPQASKGATMIFDPSQVFGGSAPKPVSGGRVAQWTFLGRLFPEVLLRDRVAVEASIGGPRTALRKRAALATGLGLASLLALFFFISFLGNRRLQSETGEVVQSVEAIRSVPGSIPSLEDLERLDALRAQVQKLARYGREGRPLWIRWGLYSGHGMFPEVRRLYFQRFRDLLFEPTRAALLASLGGLSEEASQEEYEEKYRALKAYLITTTLPDSSSASFLGPVLLDTWKGDRDVDEERQALARAQFDLYGSELPHGNPFTDPVDNLTVERARAYLRANANEQSFYAAMLSQASGRFPSIQFNRDFPGSGRFVVNAMEVPGSFTRDGWEFVLQGLDSATDFFQRESYVVGGDYFSGIDPTAMATALRARYQQEYVQTWVDFLSSAQVPNPGLRGAEGSLQELAGPRSPLFQLLDIASRNTVVDSSLVAPTFQPVHVLSPPEVTDRLFGESGQPYLAALGKLAGAMGQLAENPGSGGAQEAASAAAQAASGEIDALRLSFNTDPETALQVGSSVESLLRAPIRYARSAIGRSDVAAMDARGQQFCRTSGQVLQQFPFQAGARDADLAAVNGLLHPEGGAVWSLLEEVQSQGLTPSPEFQSFLSRARIVSDLLYGHGGEDPQLRFRLRGQPSDQVPVISLNVDGDEEGYQRNDTRWGNFTWRAATAEEVALRVQTGEQTDSLRYRGTWAVFQFFRQARWQATGSTWRLSWTLNNTSATVQADLDLAGAPPILRRDFFDDFSCPRRIVR